MRKLTKKQRWALEYLSKTSPAMPIANGGKGPSVRVVRALAAKGLAEVADPKSPESSLRVWWFWITPLGLRVLGEPS